MMLSVFSNLLTKESDPKVIDNLCAALCRMICSNVDAVPLDLVCPANVRPESISEQEVKRVLLSTGVSCSDGESSPEGGPGGEQDGAHLPGRGLQPQP